MLLRRYIRDPRKRLAIGQIALVAGILVGRFGPRFVHEAEPGFWNGFLDGVSVAFLGTSIVLMLSAWRALRGSREGDV